MMVMEAMEKLAIEIIFTMILAAEEVTRSFW
jgi:hypothetical protein